MPQKVVSTSQPEFFPPQQKNREYSANHVNRASIETFKSVLEAASPGLKKHHRLLIGPWTHNGIYSDGFHGELEYSNSAEFYRRVEKQFFDYWLRGVRGVRGV